MRFILGFAALGLLLLLCWSPPAYPVQCDPGELVIQNGTSFGECIGYCTQELRVDRDEVVHVQRAHKSSGLPDKRRARPVTAEEWVKLVEVTDLDTLLSLKSRYGCPDCYDQGAEWIEVQCGSTLKRVSLSYGASLPTIDGLLNRLRELRNSFQ